MVVYKQVENEDELRGLLALQKKNLKQNLEEDTIASQGFVTVNHSFDDIKKMHDIEPSIIAKEEEEVVGYVISMTSASQSDIPILIPMFQIFDFARFKSKPISSYKYMVVGQVCVDEKYRGQKVFDKLYEAYRNNFVGRYDIIVTEIAIENIRSLRAHDRVGFKVVHEYRDSSKIDWAIVVMEV